MIDFEGMLSSGSALRALSWNLHIMTRSEWSRAIGRLLLTS